MSTLSRRTSRSILLVAALAACATGTNSGPPPTKEVTQADLERSPGQPLERTLQAKFPGVNVNATPGGVAVTIGGPSSWDYGTAPLYVLDGSPVQPGPNGLLTGLNPYDIASIRVLRNPADIAIYGMRGSNGVVVITTKRPSQAQTP